MVVDRYTKGVLTVIAVCLVYQCAMSAGKVVEAQTQGSNMGRVQPVVVVGWGEMSLRTGEIAMLKRQDVPTTDIMLPVRLPNSKQMPLSVSVEAAPPATLNYAPDHPLPVAINAIRDASGAWEPIRSRVEGQPMGATPGSPRQ